jgi:hypothetical protein
MPKAVILDLVAPHDDMKPHILRRRQADAVIVLTPSAFNYCRSRQIPAIGLHDIISREEFRDRALLLYQRVFDFNSTNEHQAYYCQMASFLCAHLTQDVLCDFLFREGFDDIHYITDRNRTWTGQATLDNSMSLLDFHLQEASKKFSEIKITRIKHRWRLSAVLTMVRAGVAIFRRLLFKIKQLIFEPSIYLTISRTLDETFYAPSIKGNVRFTIPYDVFSFINIEPISFAYSFPGQNLKKSQGWLSAEKFLLIEKNELHSKGFDFYQHGSYFYNNIFLRWNEIKYAKRNFVYNEHTKEMFENLGARSVEVVGAPKYAKKPITDNRDIDFLYIMQGHDFCGHTQYVDFASSQHAFDGIHLYLWQEKVVSELGARYPDKKIVIKVHPAALYHGLHVPYQQFCESMTNVIIDTSSDLGVLIDRSCTIISDYFCSNFSNPFIFDGRQIVLFTGGSTPIERETVDRLSELFTLIECPDQLLNAIEKESDSKNPSVSAREAINFFCSINLGAQS